MIWVLLVILLTVVAVGGRSGLRALGTRRELRLQEADEFRLNRKVAEEDVTVFGEELIDLHIDTLTTELDEDMRWDYQQALDSYERAKALLRDAGKAADVRDVIRSLETGRHAQACVLARRDGRELPPHRAPCFFDPAHGPSSVDVMWSPPNGAEREIPVCHRDAERLSGGEAPDARLVRLGNRMVPWYAAGPAYQTYADGYFGHHWAAGRLDTIQLATLGGAGLGSGMDPWAGTGGWSDPGGWHPGDLGGHDYGGYAGHDGHGGFDGGFGDGGGGGGGD